MTTYFLFYLHLQIVNLKYKPRKNIVMFTKTRLLALLIVLAAFGLSFYFFDQVPEQMASHWSFEGKVDGYMPKTIALYIVPGIMLALGVIFFIIPKIDPMKKNIEQFKKYYDGFVILFFLFMLLVHLQIILWNTGIEINPVTTFPIGIGILFFYIGILLENSKTNWFIGIRTPWTMSSESVWRKTHKLGARLFKASGIISIIGALFPSISLFFVLVPALLSSAYTIYYSYAEYKKEKNH